MAGELERTLGEVYGGGLKRLPSYRNLPADLLQLRQVALSGEGEPTLCPRFPEAVQAVVHVRARGAFPFFKIVLVTNATTFDLDHVQLGIRRLIHEDEIWAKLDAGTSAYHQRVNRTEVPLEKVLANILWVGRQRPVVIQSLFAILDGEEPSEAEIEAYAHRLRTLKREGADIALVQIYSASRSVRSNQCAHLPLRSLSRIAHQVRAFTGLPVEVF
jgi:wyosine [tRNA(Phe)-imidazoG37] synthetase (radical SAM superfamily)